MWLRLALAGGVLFGARALVRRKRALDVRGRVVAITGGSRGLGLVLARELVQRGARVAICARDADELRRAREDLERRRGKVLAATCDVTARDDVLHFVTSVEDELGPIDVLVNNAGVIQAGPVELMTHEDFELALDVNLRGPLHAMLAVLPGMRKRGAGRIVNIASIGGKVAMPHLAPYTTSKFALVGLSEAMRCELVRDNIYVTTVCPGLMRTGSPRHAWFKGQHRAEYAWFSIADSLSATSISAEAAARRIIDAFQHGDAGIVISPQAKLAGFLHGLAPSVVQEVLGLVARLLPGPNGSRLAHVGADSESSLAPSRLTRASDEAARRNNEL
jgi:NAD(P)-dependent dehydrogenase (short-subunit alcohol dehydrogenase family)